MMNPNDKMFSHEQYVEFQECQRLLYTIPLLLERLELLMTYCNTEDKNTVKFKLSVNQRAINCNVPAANLKRIKYGMIRLNGVYHSVSMMDCVENSGLEEICLSPLSNITMHMDSIYELLIVCEKQRGQCHYLTRDVFDDVSKRFNILKSKL